MKEKKTPSALARQMNTQKKRASFLSAFSKLGNITAACAAAGIGRRTHYAWLEDAEYRKAVAEAEEQATEVLEREAWRRAVDGVEKPVHYRGERIDTVREFSDVLLIFLLKARRPEKYRERFEHSSSMAEAKRNVHIYIPANSRDPEPESSKMLPFPQQKIEENGSTVIGGD